MRFYNTYDACTRGGKYATPVVGPSMTKQEFKDECDINTIMSKYLRQAVVPVGVKVASYGDYAEAPDYRESIEIMMRAKAQFASLPAKVRDEFKNDPEAFLEFVCKEENLDRCHDMGLLSDEGSKRIVGKRAAKVKADADALEAKVRDKLIAESAKDKAK